MNQPLPSLTIVIPNFNHGHLIRDQLDSIFSQTAQAERIIILDDASTDDSASVIQGLVSSRQNVEFIRKEKNSGPLVVINEGLGLATTDYVCFLGADDITLPRFFEKALALLARYPEAALCSAVSYVQYSSQASTWPEWLEYPSYTASFVPPERVLEMFLKFENWMVTPIYRRDMLIAAGGFDPKLRSYADGFICRVLALKHGVCFIPEILTIFRLTDSGYSMSDSHDERRSAQILIYSSALMATKFSGQFPVKLIARNNSRMLYRLLVSRLKNFHRSTRFVVETAQPMFGSFLLLLIVKWVSGILRLLFFFVLRFYDIPQRILLKIRRRTPPPPPVRQLRTPD